MVINANSEITPSITRLNPPSLPDVSGIGYSQITVVEPGRLAFISGQVARGRGDEPIPDGLGEQTALAISNARAALEAVGASPQDLVMVRVYLVELTSERLEIVMPYLLGFFDGAQPSLTGVGVAALASPDYQIEVEMIARVPS